MNQRIGFYSRPYPHVNSWFSMIDCAAAHGMAVLEGFTNMELETPDRELAKRIRAYADKRGIRFSCLSCYATFNPENAQEQIRRMQAYTEIAAILGSPYFHHTLIADLEAPERIVENRELLLTTAIHAVREIYDYGQTVGVRLIYEDQGYLINGEKGFGEFLNRVDRDVGIVLDFGNHYNVDETVDGFFRAFLDRVCHVHLKDVICAAQPDGTPGWIPTLKGNYFKVVPMGQGIMEHGKYVKMLEEAGYQGCYSLEFGAESEASPVINQALEKLNSWLQR